jgi:imidazolonepropionase-like amidohydrolase
MLESKSVSLGIANRGKGLLLICAVLITVSAADLIDHSDVLGSIEVNKYADIIATNGSPLADIQELLNVDFVMKAGKVIKHN